MCLPFYSAAAASRKRKAGGTRRGPSRGRSRHADDVSLGAPVSFSVDAPRCYLMEGAPARAVDAPPRCFDGARVLAPSHFDNVSPVAPAPAVDARRYYVVQGAPALAVDAPGGGVGPVGCRVLAGGALVGGGGLVPVRGAPAGVGEGATVGCFGVVCPVGCHVLGGGVPAGCVVPAGGPLGGGAPAGGLAGAQAGVSVGGVAAGAPVGGVVPVAIDPPSGKHKEKETPSLPPSLDSGLHFPLEVVSPTLKRAVDVADAAFLKQVVESASDDQVEPFVEPFVEPHTKRISRRSAKSQEQTSVQLCKLLWPVHTRRHVPRVTFPLARNTLDLTPLDSHANSASLGTRICFKN